MILNSGTAKIRLEGDIVPDGLSITDGRPGRLRIFYREGDKILTIKTWDPFNVEMYSWEVEERDD
jgi:hypothetical protein